MSAAAGATSIASQSSPHDSAQLVSEGIWPTNNVTRRRFDPAYASSVCQVCKNIMDRRMGARNWEDMILLSKTRSTDMQSTALLHVSCAQNLLSENGWVDDTIPLESIRCTQFQLNPDLLRHSRQLHRNGRFNWRYMGGREWPQSAEHSAADYYTCLSCQHPFRTDEGREYPCK